MMCLVITRVLPFLLLVSNGQSVVVEEKIVNGVEATNFIPYQASIRVTIRDQARFGRGHTCGGVLISRLTVTTAAHCLFDGPRLRNAFDLRVVLGSLNRFEFTDDTVIRTVERIIVHPDYRRGASFSHDIGLLLLRSPVKFTETIHSIPIIDHAVYDFTNCQVSGWGATVSGGSMPSELRKGNVSIVERRVCNSTNSYGNIFVDGMVCANAVTDIGIVDICQGDSGGPLTCANKLVGLSSFGSRCGYFENLPGVFADVFFYRDWIERNWNACGKPSSCIVLLILLCIVSLSNLRLSKSFL